MNPSEAKEFRNSQMQKLSDHLQVVTCKGDKIVFSRSFNIGYINNGKFFVKPEYVNHSNIFIKQDISFIEKTYQVVATTEAEEVKRIAAEQERQEKINKALKDKKKAEEDAKAAEEKKAKEAEEGKANGGKPGAKKK